MLKDTNRILAIAIAFLVIMGLQSSSVLAESPHSQIMQRLDAIQDTLDYDVVPYLTGMGVPRTGQTTPHGTGDDGELQKGVPWPDPRFTDNEDGTITDNLTGLIWLQNARCFGEQTWADALSVCNTLASPACGLSDGSVAGDWRLPNRKELESLLDFGYGIVLPFRPPFFNFGQKYWTSTGGSAQQVWFIQYNGVVDATPGEVSWSVWPVRDAK